MMFPRDGRYKCASCGREEDATGKAQVYKTDSQNREMTVVSENDATLPKTRITCPDCGHTEAYYVIRQTRAADEPETMFYRCCRCNHTWRQN